MHSIVESNPSGADHSVTDSRRQGHQRGQCRYQIQPRRIAEDADYTNVDALVPPSRSRAWSRGDHWCTRIAEHSCASEQFDRDMAANAAKNNLPMRMSDSPAARRHGGAIGGRGSC